MVSDKITKEQRSNNMRAIRSQSQLENLVSKRLWRRGIRFRKNVKGLKGTPDIVIQKYKVVIFIDSCFWHGCPLHFVMPKTNTDFWDKKIQRNRERDKEVNLFYTEKGWSLKRVWEHEIKSDVELVVDGIVNLIYMAKANGNY